MKLSAYLSGVLSNFKDSRVIENVTELVQNIIEHKSIRLWSISEDKAEFERSKRLLDGALKSVLDDKKISAAIRDHSVAVDVTGEKLYLGGSGGVEFAHGQSWVLKKLRVKKKVYQDAKCMAEWGTLTLKGHDYTVVWITPTDHQDKPIYKQPLLLITNIVVKTAEQARGIYGLYLMRAKIEAVFKFLKDVLGWEEFQVRDYEAIKNIIALA